MAGGDPRRDDPFFEQLTAAASKGQRIIVDLLYGDHQVGQRTIARFGIGVDAENQESWGEVVRYWNLDRAHPC